MCEKRSSLGKGGSWWWNEEEEGNDKRERTHNALSKIGTEENKRRYRSMKK